MRIRTRCSRLSFILTVLALPIASKVICQSNETSPGANEKIAVIFNNTICMVDMNSWSKEDSN